MNGVTLEGIGAEIKDQLKQRVVGWVGVGWDRTGERREERREAVRDAGREEGAST
jgi:hypothetical protein